MAQTQICQNDNVVTNVDADGRLNEVKDILREFLNQIMASSDGFCAAEAHPDGGKLYNDVSHKVGAFIQGAGDDPEFIEKITVAGCDFAEIIYGHTSLEHQRYIALYTACMFYLDDLGSRHLDAVGQFSRRFVTGEKQLVPALDVFADVLKQAYDLWPQVGADAIVAGTLEGVTAMHLEYTTGGMAVMPRATWWPNYLRNRTLFCALFAHLNFMKSWWATPDTYIQLLLYFEFVVSGANDVLSFYKEDLTGESQNYVHIRATTDQTTATAMLRILATEVLDCAKRARELIGNDDPELLAIWELFERGYVSLHVKTPRYRLAELSTNQDA